MNQTPPPACSLVPARRSTTTPTARSKGITHSKIAWLPDEEREGYLGVVQHFVQERQIERRPPIVFEGNIPSDPAGNSELMTLLGAHGDYESSTQYSVPGPHSPSGRATSAEETSRPQQWLVPSNLAGRCRRDRTADVRHVSAAGGEQPADRRAGPQRRDRRPGNGRCRFDGTVLGERRHGKRVDSGAVVDSRW